jgi:LysR family transcriptional regulator, benzoate and cis,cis-muconate-responsive activator of ben and cat genes
VELRHLRYFVAVAEMENVSRAALKLHVSQPALSRQIRDLEDEIGFQLLERTAKSVRLTDAGRAFLNDARVLLQHADEAVKKARTIASEEPTELHVGYSPTPFAEILPKTLRAFQKAMPNVHVRLHDWRNKEILDGLHDGRLHLGLLVPPTRASSMRDLHYEELFRDRVCVVVAPQHPFARRRAIPLTEVAAEPLIGLTREDYPNYYDILSTVFSKVKQKPRVIEEHDSMFAVMSAVEAGTGVAIAADFGYSFGKRAKFLHLTPEPKPVSVGIAGPKGKQCPAAEKFWQYAKEAAATKSDLLRAGFPRGVFVSSQPDA